MKKPLTNQRLFEYWWRRSLPNSVLGCRVKMILVAGVK
jgi:hypothetical protein